MADTLESWIERDLRPRYGSLRAIAELIGMTESGFFRGTKRGTLSAENLLELASKTETHPSTVLRLAGKERLADLIEQLYGKSVDGLTVPEQQHLAKWRRLKASVRANIETIMSDLVADEAAPSVTEKKKRTA